MSRPEKVDAKTLKDFLGALGLVPKQNSVSYIFPCPRCGKDDKLYMRKKDGRFVCWVCRDSENFEGRPEYALAEMLDRPVREVQELLYGAIPEAQGEVFLSTKLSDFVSLDDPLDDIEQEPLYPVMYPPDVLPIDHRHSGKAIDYLASRGISLDLAKKYDLRYQPGERRVLFPVKINQVLYGWQARLIVPDKFYDEEAERVVSIPKMLGSLGLRKDKTLMFADNMNGSNHVVLCEGPIDAIKADLCGGNVASMGKAVSMAQLELIRMSGIRKVYLALDPDAAQETINLSQRLGDLETYVLQPPKGKKDLGDCTPEEVRRQFLSAQRINSNKCLTYLDTDRAFLKAL